MRQNYLVGYAAAIRHRRIIHPPIFAQAAGAKDIRMNASRSTSARSTISAQAVGSLLDASLIHGGFSVEDLCGI
jgi:hypothetical protein